MVALGLLLWVATLPGNVAAAVNVSFTSLEISGDWMETWYTHEDDQTHNASDNFQHITTSGPGLSVSAASSPFGWGTAGAAVGPFNLSLQAESTPASIAYDWGIGSISPTWIHIFATATNRFQVDGSVLEVLWLGYADFNYRLDEQDFSLVLTDVTSATALLDLKASADWSPWREAGFNGFYQFAVDPVHEYEVVLSGWITSFDAKYAELHSQVELTVVPEPGVALLLLVGGAFLLLKAEIGKRKAGNAEVLKS